LKIENRPSNQNLKQKKFAFCDAIPSISTKLKTLMKNWHLKEKEPLLKEIFTKLPLISYKRGRSFKDIIVRSKL